MYLHPHAITTSRYSLLRSEQWLWEREEKEKQEKKSVNIQKFEQNN